MDKKERNGIINTSLVFAVGVGTAIYGYVYDSERCLSMGCVVAAISLYFGFVLYSMINAPLITELPENEYCDEQSGPENEEKDTKSGEA